MDVGDTLTCRLYKGGKIEVTLDDRVYPDRSCGQYEAGWWVYRLVALSLSKFRTDEYFLSESGTLYESSGGGAYTQPCGISVSLVRRMREMEIL